MANLVMDFVERSMDYVERSLKLLEWSEEELRATDPEGKNAKDEFRHIRLSSDILARFMEGSTVYQILTIDGINRFVNDCVAAGIWDFILGLQQYTFAPFSQKEVALVVEAISFAIAPDKTIIMEGVTIPEGYSQSPAGPDDLENTPKKIQVLLCANPWLLPLVALAFTQDIPVFLSEPKNA